MRERRRILRGECGDIVKGRGNRIGWGGDEVGYKMAGCRFEAGYGL